MRSFFGYRLKQQQEVFYRDTNSIRFNEFNFYFVSNQKFIEDTIFEETSDGILGLDGVILNKKSLIKDDENWRDFFVNDYQFSTHKVKQLRGNFSGFYFDKNSNQLILFNDAYGAKNFSIYKDDNVFAFASTETDLIQLLKKLGVSLSPNPKAIYSFLKYGFLFSEISWLKEAKRMKAGSILKINNAKIESSVYKVFEKTSNALSKSKLLDEWNQIFEEAVKLQYQKDLEHGYNHFTTLSGGLDSRATTLCAFKLGYKNQNTFCCSQSGYADDKIAKQIAKDYKFNHLFEPLDQPTHYYEAEELLSKVGSISEYSGAGHFIYSLEKVWKDEFGLIHSGHLGDGVMGGFLSDTNIKLPNLNFGEISSDNVLNDTNFVTKYTNEYESEEQFKLYERGFIYAASGVYGSEHLSYNIAPFTQIEAIDFLMSVPPEYKYQLNFYWEWMNKYHKDWQKYNWEAIHSKPNAKWKMKHKTTYLRARYGWKKLFSKEFKQKFTMVPEQHWYDTDMELRRFFSQTNQNLLNHLNPKDIPYFDTILEYSKSDKIKKQSVVVSLLTVLNEILRN